MGHYLLKDSPKTGTGDLLISVQAINPICIPIPTKEEDDIFKNLIHKQINSFSPEIDKEINMRVYELYHLTPEEIMIVEKLEN